MRLKKLIVLNLLILFFTIGCINKVPNSENPNSENTTIKNEIPNGSQIDNNTIEKPLGTFYYPWTGGNPEVSPDKKETWLHWKDDNHNPPKTWASNYMPDYGSSDPYVALYSSKDINIIKKQFELMNKAGINFVISSWWGQNHYTDQALDIIFKQILPTDAGKGLKFAIYYEKEGFADVPKSEIVSDINYIKNKYSISDNYYKIDGKPVVFVYNTKSGLFKETSVQEAQKWKEVRDETGIYLVLKVFGGFEKVKEDADSWHEYAPASSFKQVKNYSAFISPGFAKWHESSRLERENFTRFENDVKSLKNADVQFKLIETWNEWGEGTGIEPATKINHDDINGFTIMTNSYGTQYIDILGKYFNN